MNRRGFLTSILALGAAPAIVRADSLMRIVPRETGIISAAEYTWTQVGGTILINSTDATIVPTQELIDLLAARIRVAQATMLAQLSGDLYGKGA